MRAAALGSIGLLAIAAAIGCDGSGAILEPQGDAIVVSVTPGNAVVPPAGTADFQATVTEVTAGTTDAIHWTVNGAGCTGQACGTLVVLGPHAVRFTAPTVAPVPSTVVLSAISDMPAENRDVAYITVGTVPISVSVDPSSLSLPDCTSAAFTATVSADVAGAGVVWSLEGNLCDVGSCGTVFPGTTASGVATTYAAACSSSGPLTAGVTIRATSISDPSRSATAQVTILGR